MVIGQGQGTGNASRQRPPAPARSLAGLLVLVFVLLSGLLFSTQTASYASHGGLFHGPLRYLDDMGATVGETIGDRIVPAFNNATLAASEAAGRMGETFGPTVAKSPWNLYEAAKDLVVGFKLKDGETANSDLGSGGSATVYVHPDWNVLCPADGSPSCEQPAPAPSSAGMDAPGSSSTSSWGPVVTITVAAGSGTTTGGWTLKYDQTGSWGSTTYVYPKHSDGRNCGSVVSATAGGTGPGSGKTVSGSWGAACPSGQGFSHLEFHTYDGVTAAYKDTGVRIAGSAPSCGTENPTGFAYVKVQHKTESLPVDYSWAVTTATTGQSLTGSNSACQSIAYADGTTSADVSYIEVRVEGLIVYTWELVPYDPTDKTQNPDRTGIPYSRCGKVTETGGFEEINVYGTPVTYNEHEAFGDLADPAPVSFRLPACPASHPIRTGWGVVGQFTPSGAPGPPMYSATAPTIPPAFDQCAHYQCPVTSEPTSQPGGCYTAVDGKISDDPCPPAGDGTYCSWGPYNVPADECAEETEEASAAEGCTPDGWSNLNPFAWVTQGLPCVLKSLFQPSADAMTRWSERVDSIKQRQPIAAGLGGVDAVQGLAADLKCTTELSDASCSDGGSALPVLTDPTGQHELDLLGAAGDTVQSVWGGKLYALLQFAIVVSGAFLIWHRTAASLGSRE